MRDVPHHLIFEYVTSSCAAVWGGLGDAALLEEVHHWISGVGFGIKIHASFQSSLSASLSRRDVIP